MGKIIDIEIPTYLQTLDLHNKTEWLDDLEGLNEDALNIIEIRKSRDAPPFNVLGSLVSLKPHVATKKQLEYFAAFKHWCTIVNLAIESGTWDKKSLMYLEHIYYQLKFYDKYAETNAIGKYIGNKLNSIAKNNINIFSV